MLAGFFQLVQQFIHGGENVMKLPEVHFGLQDQLPLPEGL